MKNRPGKSPKPSEPLVIIYKHMFDQGFRVLGIDPGLSRMGYGVVEEEGPRTVLVAAGTLRTSEAPAAARLRTLLLDLQSLISQFTPHAVAVERVFLKLNRQTACGAIQAQGLALAAAGLAGLDATEYSPAQVKQAVCGTGSATKPQVQFMVRTLLCAEGPADEPDAHDALAVAITHLHSRRIAQLDRAR